jgi:hypothetical protein
VGLDLRKIIVHTSIAANAVLMCGFIHDFHSESVKIYYIHPEFFCLLWRYTVDVRPPANVLMIVTTKQVCDEDVIDQLFDV